MGSRDPDSDGVGGPGKPVRDGGSNGAWPYSVVGGVPTPRRAIMRQSKREGIRPKETTPRETSTKRTQWRFQRLKPPYHA